MKGEIQPDHIPVNKFALKVVGLLDFYASTISGLEDELMTIDLPDRTKASGGVRGPSEFTMMTPMHHLTEIAAMEIWFKEGQDPISPTYKKPCTLIMTSLSGNKSKSYTLIGVFVSKRVLPDLDKSDDGEMAQIEWTMSVDDIIPL
jgi:hypothetical protein